MHPRETARLYPDKPAFIMAGSGVTVSYGALVKRANQTGRLLRGLGLRRGGGCHGFGCRHRRPG